MRQPYVCLLIVWRVFRFSSNLTNYRVFIVNYAFLLLSIILFVVHLLMLFYSYCFYLTLSVSFSLCFFLTLAHPRSKFKVVWRSYHKRKQIADLHFHSVFALSAVSYQSRFLFLFRSLSSSFYTHIYICI